MSYEDYIGMFWEKVRTLRLDTTQIAMGLALLQLWREAGYPSRYSVPNEVLCDLLSVSKQTLVRARKRLIDDAVIVFEDGNARRQPVYVFGVAAVVPGAMEVVEVPPPTKKDVRKPRAMKVADGELSLFSEKDMEQPKRIKREPEPPSRAVVLMECRRKGMTDEEAQEFYDYYNAQGWVTSSGQRIKNVDSMINRWLTIQKKRDDESNRRFIQQQRPSAADNIREAQQYAIDKMRRQAFEETDGDGRGVPEALPDYL